MEELHADWRLPQLKDKFDKLNETHTLLKSNQHNPMEAFNNLLHHVYISISQKEVLQDTPRFRILGLAMLA